MGMNDEKIGGNSCVTAASCLKGEIQESLHTGECSPIWDWRVKEIETMVDSFLLFSFQYTVVAQLIKVLQKTNFGKMEG